MSGKGEAVAGWGEFRQLALVLDRFLEPVHKRELLKVSLWAGGLSLLEMLVAAMVVPYVQCLNGECLPVLDSAMVSMGWPAIPVLTAGLFLLIVAKLATEAGLAWRAASFNQNVQRGTVNRLLRAYLYLDWATFHGQNRAHYYRRCATTAVDAAYVSQQGVTIIASVLVIVCLTGLMIWRNPWVSLFLIAGFALINATTQHMVGRALRFAAHEREAAMQRWNIGMAEAFASFREIRAYGMEDFFLGHVDRATGALASANRRMSFFSVLPRLVLDFAVIGVLLLVVSLWLTLERPMADLLPSLIFYAVVARTLLPAMMNLASTRAVLRGSVLNIELILHELSEADVARVDRIGVVATPATRPGFGLERVTFRHAADLPPLFAEVTMTLPHPSWLAIVGPSGAGKSTLMELLCGILVPESGRVVHAWPGQEAPRIAYVPQHIALLDGNVMDNVVFGLDAGDPARVDEAIGQARLSEVVAGLAGGQQARIGADGAHLSGGERQRLALARALYRRPDLLLLDEATSGLDEATETRLLSDLRQAHPELSVVYISHRASTLRFADRVLRLENGTLADVTPEP